MTFGLGRIPRGEGTASGKITTALGGRRIRIWLDGTMTARRL